MKLKKRLKGAYVGFARVYMEVGILNTMSISYAVQLLKGYSSYKVFKEMPRHRLRYFNVSLADIVLFISIIFDRNKAII